MGKQAFGWLAAVAGMAAWGSTAVGATQNFFDFDPDGAGPLATIPNVVQFGYANDNTLAVCMNTALANFVGGSGATTFNAYAQGRLESLTNGTSNNVTPAFIAAKTAEYTFVAGFQEQVVATLFGTPGTSGSLLQFRATEIGRAHV